LMSKAKAKHIETTSEVETLAELLARPELRSKLQNVMRSLLGRIVVDTKAKTYSVLNHSGQPIVENVSLAFKAGK
jgi:hypothetical protein